MTTTCKLEAPPDQSCPELTLNQLGRQPRSLREPPSLRLLLRRLVNRPMQEHESAMRRVFKLLLHRLLRRRDAGV
jgi:hypothetical protein